MNFIKVVKEKKGYFFLLIVGICLANPVLAFKTDTDKDASFFSKLTYQFQLQIRKELKEVRVTHKLPIKQYFVEDKAIQLKNILPNYQPTALMPTDVCPDIDIVDLRNIVGFAQLDDLNLCGQADTLSLIVYSGDLGTIRGFELAVDLPDGIIYAGWEFTTNDGTAIYNNNPSETRPEFTIKGFDADSLIIVNIGLKALCGVDLATLLMIDFEYNFTYIDTLDGLHNCSGTYTPSNEFNSSIKQPVLNVLSPLVPAEVEIATVGRDTCQEINISQDGLSAYLDSFRFEIKGLDLSSSLTVKSITANGIHNVPFTYDTTAFTLNALIDGAMFVGNNLANPNDDQFNTNEIILLEVCYELSDCPTSADLPFIYTASYGCAEEICDISDQETYIRIRPTGSLMPEATTNLDEAPFVCGDDGEVSIVVKNPNVDTDQNKYTDLRIGFETCEVANMEITRVEVSGMVIPDSLYGWEGDDLYVDFSQMSVDVDGADGLVDYDEDGFFDDLKGGDSVEVKLFIGIICGIGTPDPASDICPSNDCPFNQFYVTAQTNCGTTFKDYPPGPAGFTIKYGPNSVDNPNAYPIPTSAPYLNGYDFGTFGDIGTSSSPNPVASTQEVIFCYDFSSENFNTCASSDIYLSVLFSGQEGYIFDMEIDSAVLSIDGGLSYTMPADTATDVTWDSIDMETRHLKIALGNPATNVCYKYFITMDSAWCPPPAFWFGSQQVVETCNDGSCGVGGCDLVRACKTATFYGDADNYGCPCVLDAGFRELYRDNYGYTDASKTTKVNRADVSIDNQSRFLPCDTMILEYWYTVTDAYSLTLPLQQLRLSVRNRGIDGSGTSLEDALLTINAATINLLDISFHKQGIPYSGRTSFDMADIPGCVGDSWVHNFQNIDTGDGSSAGNSTDDRQDGQEISFIIKNDCNNDTLSGCLNDFLQYLNYEANDTINIRVSVQTMKNLYREAIIKTGAGTPGATTANTMVAYGVVRRWDDQCDDVTHASDCGEDYVWFGATPGDLNAVSQVDLNSCGGSIEHTFYLNSELPLDGPDTWFKEEFRPIMNIYDVDDPFFTPMAYCGNAEIINYVGGVPMSIPISPKATDNLFCLPISGYTDDVCAVETGSEGTLFWNPYEAGAMALGVGNITSDSMKIKYDFCLLCPEEISSTDYKMVYDYGFCVDAPFNGGSFLCDDEPVCMALGTIGESGTFRWGEHLFGVAGDSSLYIFYDSCSANVVINDMRTPIENVQATLGTGAGILIASDAPGVSEEIQAIDICNPDLSQVARGVAASVTIPASVRLEDVYSNVGGTSPLTTALVSDNGLEKTYTITLPYDTLNPNGTCYTLYVGTSLLYCPAPGELPATVCINALSGCSPIELRTALSGPNGCGDTEVCYAYISGEVGIQNEWFDMPSNPDLCDTMTFNMRIKNVKQLELLEIDPMFTIPNGLTIIPGSWQVAYPGGPVTTGTWDSIPDPDTILGNTYGYKDDLTWSTYINTNGLEGVSVNNATVDSNKVAFRFRAATNCDEFLSGAKLQVETMANDPCAAERITSGSVESPSVVISGAAPIDNAQILQISDPDDLNCMATVNTFGITALNTSDKPTADSVITCITLPEALTYVPNSMRIVLPTDYTVSETITITGTNTEICFVSPPIGASGSMKLSFDAAVANDAACGDIKIYSDIKSVVENLTCSTGSPTECDVLVQNSINPELNVTIKPPFIAEDLNVYTDCAVNSDSVALYYEYTINHNGPDATNQPYTINFYEDVDGDQKINANIDILLGTESSQFSVNDGASIQINGSIDIPKNKSCPVLFEVVYSTACTCDREEAYFNNIEFRALSAYQDPITMCPGSCFDIEICDFVEVASDSVKGATGIPYIPSLNWVAANCYSFPHDSSGTSVIKGPPNAYLDYTELTNNSVGSFAGEEGFLFAEQSNQSASCGFAPGEDYGEAWLIATYPYPVNVDSIFMGTGKVSGWANTLNVYESHKLKLEYSNDGINWTNIGTSFENPAGISDVGGYGLPNSITAQYWRVSSNNNPGNWGTTEFRLEGTNIPFQSTPPVSRVDNTVTICVPEGVGIDSPWEVNFTTGTGNCQVTETIEIWSLEADAITISGDSIACGTECINLEVVVPNDANNGMTVRWSPANLVNDSTAFRVEACNLPGNTFFEAIVTYSDSTCVDTVAFQVNQYPINSISVTADTIYCYNPLIPPVLTADAGWEIYEWYEVSTGIEFLEFSSFSNEYILPAGGTYLVKASSTGTQCPAISTAITVGSTICEMDLGDLPDNVAGTSTDNYETLLANNGPSHVLTDDLFLGVAIDSELDGQPSSDALSDGVDEDGIVIYPSLDISPGGTIRLPLSITNGTVDTAFFEAWIDWNGDGDFDEGNEIVASLDDGTTGFPASLVISVPEDAKIDAFLGVRLRLSHTDNMSPYGPANSGEVEDYLIGIACSQICLPIDIEIKKE